ncbi:P pilus assembly protein, chaperone PapD [Vibrio cincinnatiensis]|uniref:P pilus assembly protein, chaperone PapD n=1 Tax=Vibrio cincinnatiensis DSM 19608 TaxID=1123491 RepID=A0A1T4NSM1_VIBCI|nr:fimbria/pilus periplasmic chaperone [Vibrio cincinnatiensis]SJZ82310.1 P pilus assembly protein, chaperone PapD [Vibrio cincinnatiensis DSM 19608]SUP05455.1 P pilus assembly protein, chaperone PapD [Vibrio cincinnatiensis]
MKWFVTKIVTFFLFLPISSSIYAAFVLDSTRYIYKEGQPSMSLSLSNYSDKLFGGQVWIENTHDTEDIPFSVIPNIFTLDSKKKQKIQVSVLESDDLSKNKEMLFWLNVQEIPLKSTEEEGESNILRMAARTKVKFIYRPKEIQNNREQAEEGITIEKSEEILVFNNNTPYYFAIVKVNQQSVNDLSLTSFSPYSQARYALPSMDKNRKIIEFSAIDDWGEVYAYRCDLSRTQNQCRQVKKDRP